MAPKQKCFLLSVLNLKAWNQILQSCLTLNVKNPTESTISSKTPETCVVPVWLPPTTSEFFFQAVIAESGMKLALQSLGPLS